MGKIALRLALLRRIVRPLGVFVHRQKADEVPLGAVNGHLTQGALGGTWALRVRVRCKGPGVCE